MSYYFSEKHQDEPFFYLNSESYRYDNNFPKVEEDKEELIEKFKIIIDKKRHRYVNHYIGKENVLPLWVIIGALTFGQVSKLYDLSYPGIKNKVCLEYRSIKTVDMGLMLELLTKFRNVCAYNERLYDYDIISVEMPDTSIHEQMKIRKEKGKYKNGKRDLFAALISFRYLLEKDDFINCCSEVESVFNGLRFASNTIQQADIIQKTGFPRNWKTVGDLNISKVYATF